MNSKMKNMRLALEDAEAKCPHSKPNTRKPHSNWKRLKSDVRPPKVHSRRPARELSRKPNRWPPPADHPSVHPANDPACERPQPRIKRTFTWTLVSCRTFRTH